MCPLDWRESTRPAANVVCPMVGKVRRSSQGFLETVGVVCASRVTAMKVEGIGGRKARWELDIALKQTIQTNFKPARSSNATPLPVPNTTDKRQTTGEHVPCPDEQAITTNNAQAQQNHVPGVRHSMRNDNHLLFPSLCRALRWLCADDFIIGVPASPPRPPVGRGGVT